MEGRGTQLHINSIYPQLGMAQRIVSGTLLDTPAGHM